MGLPAKPGTYAVLMASDAETEVRIGSLGTFRVRPGCYAYVGSALGPGGLAARVLRHWRQVKPLRWHIDYLRAAVPLQEVWYTLGGKRRECQWADVLARMPECSCPIPGFGASDCTCDSHLFYFQGKPSVRLLGKFTRSTTPDGALIRRLTANRLPLSYVRA
jgi:Uri superfamily endonuclease